MKRDSHLMWGLVLITFGWVCIAALLHGCGGFDPLPPLCEQPEVAAVEAEIVGGVPSTERRSTVMVSSSRGFCSGSIVGPHTVLTAAHCENMSRVLIDLPVWGRVIVGVVDELEHPSAVRPGPRDLRLLYTEEELPGPFATLGYPSECSSFVVQGYGQDKPGRLYEREVYETARGFGVVYFTQGSCRGDSGGPAYAMTEDGPVQVAVVSFGNLPCDERDKAGYVDLTQDGNIEWIQENIR